MEPRPVLIPLDGGCVLNTFQIPIDDEGFSRLVAQAKTLVKKVPTLSIRLVQNPGVILYKNHESPQTRETRVEFWDRGGWVSAITGKVRSGPEWKSLAHDYHLVMPGPDMASFPDFFVMALGLSPRDFWPGAEQEPLKKYEWLAKAMLLVRDHPEWSDRQIAKEVGKHPGTLSRSDDYQQAAAMAREPRKPATGYKDSSNGAFDAWREE